MSDTNKELEGAQTPAPDAAAVAATTATPDDPWAYGAWPVIGTFWALLLLIVAETGVLFHSYASSNYLFGLASVFVLIGLLHFGGKLHFINQVVKRPGRSLFYVGTYMVIGFLWIGGYWTVETRKAARIAMEDKQAWLRSHGIEDSNTVPDALVPEWKKYVEANPKIYSIPRYYDHKADLAWRGLFWPVSILHTLLADVVYEFYIWVIELYGKILDGISKWMFQDVLKELPQAPANK